MTVEEARIAYTGHVVTRSCCTGGRLCPGGRVLAARAVVEEARDEYLEQMEWLAAVEKLIRERGPNPYFLATRARIGNDFDALSIALDLAVAQAVEERARASVIS